MKKLFGNVLLTLLLLMPAFAWSATVLSQTQLAPLNSPIYTTYPMKQKYWEKDKTKNIIYFTEEQREKERVIIVEGLLYNSSGELLAETSKANGNLQYVMDAFGNIYIFDDQPVIRHSSILDGNPVAAAGDITLINGKISQIDANSGHYFVLTSYQSEALTNILKELATRGVKLEGI